MNLNFEGLDEQRFLFAIVHGFGSRRRAGGGAAAGIADLGSDGAFEALLHRLWFDIHVHSHESVALLRSRVNCERLLFGTNFAGWDQQPGDIRAAARPYADNARRLLRA